MSSIWLRVYSFAPQLGKKIFSAWKSKPFTGRKAMNKHPLRHLPIPVREAFVQHLLNAHRVHELPYTVSIRGDKAWMYYSPPKRGCTAFLMNVNMTAKNSVSVHFGDYEAQYPERECDRDKTKRALDKGRAIVKGYLITVGDRVTVSDETEVIFHPSQVIKPIPEVKLDDRSRRILFCYGVLKEGTMRREALHRLDVSKPEIEFLVEKGLLKKAGNGHTMTVLGEANRLPRTTPGEKIVVDQW